VETRSAIRCSRGSQCGPRRTLGSKLCHRCIIPGVEVSNADKGFDYNRKGFGRSDFDPGSFLGGVVFSSETRKGSGDDPSTQVSGDSIFRRGSVGDDPVFCACEVAFVP